MHRINKAIYSITSSTRASSADASLFCVAKLNKKNCARPEMFHNHVNGRFHSGHRPDWRFRPGISAASIEAGLKL